MSGGPKGGGYSDGCQGGARNLMLTAQEKALVFMSFDIASYVDSIASLGSFVGSDVEAIEHIGFASSVWRKHAVLGDGYE